MLPFNFFLMFPYSPVMRQGEQNVPFSKPLTIFILLIYWYIMI